MEIRHPLAAFADGRLRLGVQAAPEQLATAAIKMARSWAYHAQNARSFSFDLGKAYGTSVTMIVRYFSCAAEGTYAI